MGYQEFGYFSGKHTETLWSGFSNQVFFIQALEAEQTCFPDDSNPAIPTSTDVWTYNEEFLNLGPSTSPTAYSLTVSPVSSIPVDMEANSFDTSIYDAGYDTI